MLSVALRHDVDSLLGLTIGVPRVAKLEDKFDARSTFYVRVAVLKRAGARALRLLEELRENGWQIGLHIDNSVDAAKLPSMWHELEALESLVGRTYTASVHGGLYGIERAALISKVCALGRWVVNVPYYDGAGYCYYIPFVTLDWLVAKLGPQALERAWRTIWRLAYSSSKGVGVLTHPEYFVLSVGCKFTLSPRSKSYKVRILKLAEKVTTLAFTALRRKLLAPYYEALLSMLKESGFRLCPVENLLPLGTDILHADASTAMDVRALRENEHKVRLISKLEPHVLRSLLQPRTEHRPRRGPSIHQ